MSIGAVESVGTPQWNCALGCFGPLVRSDFVSSRRARTASRPSLIEKWTRSLRADEDAVWRRLLSLFVGLGRSPSLYELASEAGMPVERVRLLLRELQDRDLVGLDETGETVVPDLTATCGSRASTATPWGGSPLVAR